VTSTPENCNKLPKTTTEERDWDTLEKGLDLDPTVKSS
jgi:hypothetical protein